MKRTKRIFLALCLLSVLVFLFSWFLEKPYIHVLMGLLGLSIIGTLSSIGETEEELEELKAAGDPLREWHVWVFLVFLFGAVYAADYNYPFLAEYGAK